MKSTILPHLTLLLLTSYDIGRSNGFSPPTTTTPFGIKSRSLKTETQCKETATITLDGRAIRNELTPTSDFVLVKVAQAEDQTEGGLFITGKAKEKQPMGTVVSTGPGRTIQETGVTLEMPVSPGETVIYGKYDGTEIKYNNEKHVLIQENDVLVKFAAGGGGKLEDASVINDNVLVEVIKKEEEKTAGGILIGKSSKTKKKPSLGMVVKVGPGRKAWNGTLMEMDVEVGDMLKFRDFTANEVQIDGKDYAVIRFTDILAKF